MAYTTTAALKTYLGIASASDDALLDVLVAAAQQMIDFLTKRSYEHTGDATEELFDAVDEVDGRTLFLRESACAVTEVVNNADNAIPETVSSNDYILLPRDGPPYWGVKLLHSSGLAWTYTDDAEAGIKVTAKWAHTTNADGTPDEDVVQMTKRLAAFFYRQKDAQVFDVVGLTPSGILSLPNSIPSDVLAWAKAQSPLVLT